MTSKHKALYPGSFDPLTNGHLDLIDRALHIFDEVHIAIAKNSDKKPLFSTSERVEIVKRALGNRRGIVIQAFDGLIVEYAKRMGIPIMIRGLRATSDFDYEFQLALTNRTLSKSVDTIFLMPSETNLYLSSKLVKEIAHYGGDVSRFVPKFVVPLLRKKLKEISRDY